MIPAPQPPYDFPPFMVLGRLELNVALIIYAAATVLAMLVAAIALTRIGIKADLALMAFAIPAIYMEIALGQIVTFALLCLVLAGVALALRRDALAGSLAALTVIEQ